jgi:hypothetical protein
MSEGFAPAQAGHVVNILAPVDITGGKTAQAFSMKNYAHATILLLIGVAAAAFTKILVNKCTDAAGDGATAIPFNLYTQESPGVSHDVLSARTPVTAAGYTPANASGIFYVIEIDAKELDQTHSYVQLQLTNGVNSVIAGAAAVLSGARFAEVQSPTVTA